MKPLWRIWNETVFVIGDIVDVAVALVLTVWDVVTGKIWR